MSVSTNIKVDNCPFCGGKSKVYAYLGKFYAKCIKCKTYSAPYDTPEEAAAAWNTRYYTAGDDLNNSKKGACKDCVHSKFQKYVLYCDKYNVPKLYEDWCSDFQPMQTYYEQKDEEKHKNPLNVNFDNMEEASEM